MLRSSRKHRKRLVGISFLLPGLCGVAVFYLIPFLDVIRRSFVQMASGSFCGLQNYKMVVQNDAFRLAAKNTLRFVLVCLPLLLVLSLVLAFLVNELWAYLTKRNRSGLRRDQKQSEESVNAFIDAIKAAYLLPLAIPAASVVLLWKLMFDRSGFVNGMLHLCGLSAVDWMNTGASFAVLVFSYIWKNLGYTMILWLAGLASVPQSVYEAAEMDGAKKRVQFFKITLPLIRPMIFTIVVLSFLNSFKVFREAYLVAGNYPQEDIYLLQHLFNNWFLSLSVDKMAAASVLLAGVIGVFVLILQRLWETEG